MSSPISAFSLFIAFDLFQDSEAWNVYAMDRKKEEEGEKRYCTNREAIRAIKDACNKQNIRVA